MCNKFTNIHNNKQQNYTLLANKDVATKLLQMILRELTSLKILTNILKNKSLSLVS